VSPPRYASVVVDLEGGGAVKANLINIEADPEQRSASG